MLNKNGSAGAKKKTLWIITELYYPENNQTGYYLTHIAEGLTENFDVKIICSQPSYAQRGVIAPKHEIHNNVEIFRVWNTTLDKNVILFRLINMLTNGWSVFANAILKIKRSDEVLTVSVPPSLPFVSAFAAKLKGVDYSVIIQDKYPEVLFAVKKFRPDTLIMKLARRFNTWLYSNAHKIIVMGRDMEEVVRAQLPSRSEDGHKIEVIPNWAALEEVEPRPRHGNEMLRELGLLDKFVFLYAGNMGHPQDVESIIECAHVLADHERIRFLFVGDGVKRKWIEGEVKRKNLRNVHLVDYMPREKQTLFLNACDVGLVSLVSNMYGLAMPSRTYNLLAAGKPILALTDKDSEVERVILEDKVGWITEPQNPKKLAETIESIYESRGDLKEMAIKARLVAVTKYNRDRAIEGYKKALCNGYVDHKAANSNGTSNGSANGSAHLNTMRHSA